MRRIMYRMIERLGAFFAPTELEERMEKLRAEIYLMDRDDTRW